MAETQRIEAVVIGAGQAGPAAGYHLARRRHRLVTLRAVARDAEHVVRHLAARTPRGVGSRERDELKLMWNGTVGAVRIRATAGEGAERPG